ncbi:hypothetical protein QBC35DRAFT_454084 [Podospora australis]|uniref:Uncharacterized protein n=1 Tax=Podospora australis TaxID=1536484 RepID=A0AAN6WSR4_9PEZI|nr:hypothetical protein QBC35DRAFT_454084 [Podospora australis]
MGANNSTLSAASAILDNPTHQDLSHFATSNPDMMAPQQPIQPIYSDEYLQKLTKECSDIDDKIRATQDVHGYIHAPLTYLTRFIETFQILTQTPSARLDERKAALDQQEKQLKEFSARLATWEKELERKQQEVTTRTAQNAQVAQTIGAKAKANTEKEQALVAREKHLAAHNATVARAVGAKTKANTEKEQALAAKEKLLAAKQVETNRHYEWARTQYEPGKLAMELRKAFAQGWESAFSTAFEQGRRAARPVAYKLHLQALSEIAENVTQIKQNWGPIVASGTIHKRLWELEMLVKKGKEQAEKAGKGERMTLEEMCAVTVKGDGAEYMRLAGVSPILSSHNSDVDDGEAVEDQDAEGETDNEHMLDMDAAKGTNPR